MKIKRRDFLKAAMGGGLLLASEIPRQALARGSKNVLPESAMGILYDSTLCVGCMACMTACKSANNMPADSSLKIPIWDEPQDLSAKTLNVIKKYQHGSAAEKDREIDGFAFVKRHCMHCLDPSCVSACPVSALQKNPETGVVTYNKDACIGCRYCQIACPFNIPKFEWDSAFPEITKCQLCNHLIVKGGISACCSVCPTGASLFGPVALLKDEARRRLTLEPGTYQDFPVSSIGAGRTLQFQSHKVGHYQKQIYGENEVGGTQVLIMAGIPFQKLGLPDLPEDSFVSLANGIQYAIYKGMVYPLVLLGALVYMVRRGDDHIKKEE